MDREGEEAIVGRVGCSCRKRPRRWRGPDRFCATRATRRIRPLRTRVCVDHSTGFHREKDREDASASEFDAASRSLASLRSPLQCYSLSNAARILSVHFQYSLPNLSYTTTAQAVPPLPVVIFAYPSLTSAMPFCATSADDPWLDLLVVVPLSRPAILSRRASISDRCKVGGGQLTRRPTRLNSS
jgi:hypothetical protein